jgi:segregation and condensation protein B
MTQTLKFIIESLLFVSEEPLSVAQLKSITETDDTAPILSALNALTEEYDQRGGGFELRSVAGGYQFRTRPEYSAWVKKLLKPSPARLSRAALETLAIIAYKQPIIRADVEHIRGVDCGGVLRMLLEKKLIRVLGRKDIPGRPMIYGTTRQFLEVFNLKDLRDLPSPKEIASLGAELVESSAEPEDETVPEAPATDAADSDNSRGDSPASPDQKEIRNTIPDDVPAPSSEDEDGRADGKNS